MTDFLVEISALTMRIYAKLGGVGVPELAKAVAARDASRARAKAEQAHAQQLDRIIERLPSYPQGDVAADIVDFARAEVLEVDPLQARRIVPADAFGVGAAFGNSMERRST